MKKIPARDPKQCGGSKRMRYYYVDGDVDDVDDVDNDGDDVDDDGGGGDDDVDAEEG